MSCHCGWAGRGWLGREDGGEAGSWGWRVCGDRGAGSGMGKEAGPGRSGTRPGLRGAQLGVHPAGWQPTQLRRDFCAAPWAASASASWLSLNRISALKY